MIRAQTTRCEAPAQIWRNCEGRLPPEGALSLTRTVSSACVLILAKHDGRMSDYLDLTRTLAKILRTENPPHAGRSGPREYSKLHWRTMPQDTCANEPVNATDPQVEPLPAAIRKGEDEFIVSNIAGGG